MSSPFSFGFFNVSAFQEWNWPFLGTIKELHNRKSRLRNFLSKLSPLIHINVVERNNVVFYVWDGNSNREIILHWMRKDTLKNKIMDHKLDLYILNHKADSFTNKYHPHCFHFLQLSFLYLSIAVIHNIKRNVEQTHSIECCSTYF